MLCFLVLEKENQRDFSAYTGTFTITGSESRGLSVQTRHTHVVYMPSQTKVNGVLRYK